MNSAEDPNVGRTIADRYAITRKLGEGGMGSVYLATQHPLGREVVLKVLHSKMADAETAAMRFEAEAFAVSRLNHPNIVTIYDFGTTPDDTLYIAMEYVSGLTLYQLLRDGPVPVERAQFFIESIARALAEAHAHGVVHRDLKPENIMLSETATEGTTLKVLDFGIAKMSGRDELRGQRLTEQDVIIGTPGYMAPEQIDGKDVDARTDLYALGVIWWELLIGKPPLPADSPVHVLVRHLSEPIPPPSTVSSTLRGWTPSAERLMMSLLSKDIAGRPADGGDVVQRLRALDVNEWNVQSAAQAGTLIAGNPPPSVDDFFSGSLAGGNGGPPATVVTASTSLPFPASASPPAFDPATLPPPSAAPPQVDDEDPEFSSLGGGSSAYSMMMADLYGDEADDAAPLPGGSPFALEKEEEAPSRASHLVWRVEVDGTLRDGVSIVEVRDLIGAGRIVPESQGAPQGEALAAMGTYAGFRSAFNARRLEAELSSAAREVSSPKFPAPQAAAAHPARGATGARRRRRGPLFAALAGLGIAGGAAYLVVVDPALGETLWNKVRVATGNAAQSVATTAKAQSPMLIEAVVERWATVTEDARPVAELVAEGDALIQDATPLARQKADNLYQRAVKKKPRSSVATAAFLENWAQLVADASSLDGVNPQTLLDEAAAEDPHPRLDRARGALFLADDRARRAIAPLRRALKESPRDGIAMRLLAEAYVATGQLQAARIQAEKAKELRPQDTVVDRVVAEIARQRLDLDTAQATLARRGSTTDEDRSAWKTRILLEVDRGNVDDAGVKARAIVDAAPLDDRKRLFVARTLLEKLDDRAGALELLRAAPPLAAGQSVSARAELLAYRAEVAYDAQQTARAKADFARAQERSAAVPLVQYAHARALLRDGRFADGITAAKAAAEASAGKPYAADVLVTYGDALLAESMRNADEGLSAARTQSEHLYRDALDLDAEHLGAYAGLLTLKLVTGRLTKTSPELLDAATGFASPRRHLETGALPRDTTALSRHAREVAGYRVPVDADAKQFVAAYIDVARGRAGTAQKSLRKILAKSPTLQPAAVVLGAIYLDENKPKYAKMRLEKIPPSADSVVSTLLLAQAEAQLGALDAASAHLAVAIQASPPPGLQAETEATLIEERDGLTSGRTAWRSVLDVAPGSRQARARLLEGHAPKSDKKRTSR